MEDKVVQVPVDDHQEKDDEYSIDDYAATAASAQAVRDRVLADPKGRVAYDRARAEINIHQATLARVRKSRAMAQAAVAEALGMDQSEVSRLERRSDLLLSTLRRFVEATGGRLRLVAEYPEGGVELLLGSSSDAVVQDSAEVPSGGSKDPEIPPALDIASLTRMAMLVGGLPFKEKEFNDSFAA
jgi:transcriptional regulator with XRE-family HTH domain